MDFPQNQPTDYADLVDKLAAIPDAIQRLIAERSDDELRQPGQDARVSVVEILCDQLDWEEITGLRIARILHESTPTLEHYDDTYWAIDHRYQERDAHETLEALTTLRMEIVQTLRQIPDEHWQRTGTLQSHGEVTLIWLIQRMLAHDEAHLDEIVEALI